MKSSIGEFQLIERMKRLLPPLLSKKWQVSIGDDAAVYRSSSKIQLWTQDLLLEGVHFLRGTLRHFVDLGWKALAVNLSDIAAMGGRPLGALVGMALPKDARLQEVEALYRGLGECSRHFACPIVGGDTNRSLSTWVIAITVIGESRRPPLLRSGVQAGESLWVTGSLGAAALGWDLIQRKDAQAGTAFFRKRHARPEPRLSWGQSLLDSHLVTAAIDISDGLSGDLQHLAEASQVGFQVEVEKIPRHPHFEKICRRLQLDPFSLLLAGGEDYELLFTVRSGKEKDFLRWAQRHSIAAVAIGRAHSKKNIQYHQEGRVLRRDFRAFQHFGGSRGRARP